MSTPHVPPVLIDTPSALPAGVSRLDVELEGQAVGNLDLQICQECHRGIIHDIRTDPARRRQGLATLAVTTIRDRHPGFSWSTSAIPHTPAAKAFWAALRMPTPGEPVTCRHMRAADDPGGTRRAPAVQSWTAKRRRS